MKRILAVSLILGAVVCSAGCEQSVSEAQESMFKPQYDDAMDAKKYCDAAQIANQMVELNYDTVNPHDTYFHLWLAGRRIKKWEERLKEAKDQCQQQIEDQQVNSNTDVSQISVQTADQANAAYSAKVASASAVAVTPTPVAASKVPTPTVPPATSIPVVASEPQATASTTALPVTSSASAAGRVVRCQIDSNGSPSYTGKCLFSLDKGGSFSLQNVDKVSPIAGASIVSVYIEGKGVATVSGLTKDGLNSRWGEAQRSSKDKACWVGSDFKVCAW